jgi:hypothetical protein
MKRMSCVLVFFVIIMIQLANAQGPRLLNYQGRLAEGGVPVTGTHQLTFAVYNVTSGGTAVWTEVQNVTVENGVFNVLLGSVEIFPADLFSGNAELYLGIKVGTNAEMAPRFRLASVAYSLHAADVADNAVTTMKIQDAAVTQAKLAPGISMPISGTAGGDLTGTYPDPTIAAGAVTNAKIADNSVGTAKIQDAAVTQAKLAPGISMPVSGAAGGDLAGSYPNPAVIGIHGRLISDAVPDSGQVLKWDGTTWLTQVDGLHLPFAGVTNTGNLGIAVVHNILSGSSVGGLFGSPSESGVGVFGLVNATNGSNVGGYFISAGNSGSGVLGSATAGTGITFGGNFSSSSNEGRGVRGTASATEGATYGGHFSSASTSGTGVYGLTTATSGPTYGVRGESRSTNNGAAVRGDGAYVGVWGQSTGRWGVYGFSTGSTDSYGVYGTVSAGTGNYAGYFSGNARVTGTLTKGGGAFEIDHPLDPENKILRHSFVESPDMMNVYNGIVTLQSDGTVWVELPSYFEALNHDFRYQLTPIGGPGPGLYIAEEVNNNRFQIAGGTGGLRVSWQVTGVRKDPWAEENRIIVEEYKVPELRGFYLHPEPYGQAETRSIMWGIHPDMMSMIKIEEQPQSPEYERLIEELRPLERLLHIEGRNN